MGSPRLIAIDDICQRGSVRDADVLVLRRMFEREPHLSAGDVDALFRIHTMARIQERSWPDFFVETMTDYVVREMEPAGYVTATQAGWLIGRISTAGRVRTKAEYALLLNVIDKARWVPESLMAFALTQIRDAVVTGAGPLRGGGGSAPGIITGSEIEDVRRLLFAYGNERPAAISQLEADLLIDIDQALTATAMAGSRADFDAWSELFGKAVASAVLAASGYAGPSREEALRDTPLSWRVGQTIEGRRSVVAEARGVLVFYRQLSSEALALAVLERQRIEIITGEPVRSAAASQLALRLCAGSASARAVAIMRTLFSTGAVLDPAFGANVSAVEHAA